MNPKYNRKLLGVMNKVYIFLSVVITWMHVFVKNLTAVPLKTINFMYVNYTSVNLTGKKN